MVVTTNGDDTARAAVPDVVRAVASPRPGGAWARSARPLAVAVAGAAGLALLAVVDPNQPGHYPVCPFYALTGLYCPGCGSLRALHDLAHLDLAGAWGMNPLLVLAVPFLAWTWVAWVGREVRGVPRTRLAHPGWLYALAALVLAFWVLRNVPPLAPWLAP